MKFGNNKMNEKDIFNNNMNFKKPRYYFENLPFLQYSGSHLIWSLSQLETKLVHLVSNCDSDQIKCTSQNLKSVSAFKTNFLENVKIQKKIRKFNLFQFFIFDCHIFRNFAPLDPYPIF